MWLLLRAAGRQKRRRSRLSRGGGPMAVLGGLFWPCFGHAARAGPQLDIDGARSEGDDVGLAVAVHVRVDARVGVPDKIVRALGQTVASFRKRVGLCEVVTSLADQLSACGELCRSPQPEPTTPHPAGRVRRRAPESSQRGVPSRPAVLFTKLVAIASAPG